MFMFHVALSLCLLTLTAGTALYVFAARCDGKGTCFARLIALVVIILSIFSSVCTIYWGVKFMQLAREEAQLLMMQDKSMMGDGNSKMMMNEKMNMNKKAGHAAAH